MKLHLTKLRDGPDFNYWLNSKSKHCRWYLKVCSPLLPDLGRTWTQRALVSIHESSVTLTYFRQCIVLKVISSTHKIIYEIWHNFRTMHWRKMVICENWTQANRVWIFFKQSYLFLRGKESHDHTDFFKKVLTFS